MTELTPQWRQFKSGTDIRGIASEGGPAPINLTDEAVGHMADGFILWLAHRSGKRCEQLAVSIGHDSRLSGPRLKAAVIERLHRAGCRVSDCGLSSTPAMFQSTHALSCDGAIQLTASHHPFYRNGLKFFTPDGGLDAADIETILMAAQDDLHPDDMPGGTIQTVEFMRQYAAGLRQMICDGVGGDRPLEGFHIVVDAGNGAGGFYAGEVLAPLGADVSGSRYLEPDGMFPNHIPNPEDKEAMASIREAVLTSHADLGVIFDTDVDRAGCVDAHGEEINRNRLVSLASAIALEGHTGGTIVTDSVTSDGVHEFIESTLGGRHHRFRRGYKNVINEAQRLCAQGIDCPLAIETSGHAALRENFFLDDGAYLMTRIIIKMAVLRRQGRALEDLIAGLKTPAEEAEARLSLSGDDFAAYGQRIIDDLADFAQRQPGLTLAPDNREGVRVCCGPEAGDGWFLLRLSVHDPIMPCNLESDHTGGVAQMASLLKQFLTSYERLDSSPLQTLTQE